MRGDVAKSVWEEVGASPKSTHDIRLGVGLHKSVVQVLSILKSLMKRGFIARSGEPGSYTWSRVPGAKYEPNGFRRRRRPTYVRSTDTSGKRDQNETYLRKCISAEADRFRAWISNGCQEGEYKSDVPINVDIDETSESAEESEEDMSAKGFAASGVAIWDALNDEWQPSANISRLSSKSIEHVCHTLRRMLDTGLVERSGESGAYLWRRVPGAVLPVQKKLKRSEATDEYDSLSKAPTDLTNTSRSSSSEPNHATSRPSTSAGYDGTPARTSTLAGPNAAIISQLRAKRTILENALRKLDDTIELLSDGTV